MNFELLEDFANKAAEDIGKFKLDFILSPSKILENDLGIEKLNWRSIKFGPEQIGEIPDDKRGIYAFIAKNESLILPPHGYVLYIGIAGRKSERSLRQRYIDYCNPRKSIKRPKIARMIGTWHSVLCFCYASVEDDITSEQLEIIEKKLNTALLPPFSEGDLESEIKPPRSAYRT